MRSNFRHAQTAIAALALVLTISGCARSPEQVKAHNEVLARASVEYALTPKFRWDIARSVAGLAKSSPLLFKPEYYSAEISPLDVMDVGSKSIPYYCVALGTSMLIFGHVKKYFSVTPEALPNGIILIKAQTSARGGPVCTINKGLASPFPEAIEALNGAPPPQPQRAPSPSPIPSEPKRISLGPE